MATSVVLPSTSALSSARRCREEAARLLHLAAPQRRRVRANSRCRVVAAVGPEVADAASVAVEAIAPTMMTVKFFASGGVSACASHSVGVPLDVVKTRVQAAPAGSKLRQQAEVGLLAGVTHLIAEEGPSILLQGMGPTFFGYFVQGSLKYGLYQVFKGDSAGLVGAALVLHQVVAASAADTVGSTALCPLEATRIRLVMDRTYAPGFLPGLSRLAREEGLDGLLGTLPAILAKQIPYTALQLVTYDQVHDALLSAGCSPVTASVVGALAAALPASLASQPGDTLLTRLNEVGRVPLGGGGRGGRLMSCVSEMRSAAAEMGVAGLFAGWRERLWHVGTIVVVQLLINDYVKHSLGL